MTFPRGARDEEWLCQTRTKNFSADPRSPSPMWRSHERSGDSKMIIGKFTTSENGKIEGFIQTLAVRWGLFSTRKQTVPTTA
jgi:hypothetical protein